MPNQLDLETFECFGDDISSTAYEQIIAEAGRQIAEKLDAKWQEVNAEYKKKAGDFMRLYHVCDGLEIAEALVREWTGAPDA